MAVKDPEISSFIFLSGCDKTYTGQIRAHVLKHHLKIRKENSLVPRRYIQDKTYKRSRIGGGCHEPAEITSEIPSQGRSQAKVSCTHNTLRKADLCGVSLGNKCSLGAEAYCISSAVACTSSAISLVEDHQGPCDLLVPRASRTLFPDFTERQAYLYHHFLTGITSHLFSVDTMRAQFHPLRDIFAPRFMGQEISVSTALYCASTHLSRLSGNLPGHEALQSESAVCRSLNKRLSCVHTQADDFSVMAVLGMICVDVEIRPRDDSPEKRRRVASHIRGLRGMIHQRGGWSTLKNSPVAFHLHWFDIICAGEISLGLTPPSHYLESTRDCKSHLELCVGELCAFYRSLCCQQVSFIGHLVEPGSIIRSLLAKLGCSVLPERLAVLTCLCAAFNDLTDSPSRMQYIVKLEQKLTAQVLCLEASLVGVLWSLIIDFDDLILESPERTWLLSRLMYVAAKLSADLRSRLENQLLRLLISDSRDQLLLEPEDLEAEIWRDIALVKVKEDRDGTAA